ncbi:MAG TPA: Holliday junction branch migration protein RuvA [Gemmatimonadales bacterium]|nr:Holliday junction branch migration protein RuvA [Gemmatimonadales bacterium]
MIASVSGRLSAKGADRVVVDTAGGVGYEVTVPLGVMERLPGLGETVTLATELVVREDGWALYGFLEDAERRLFQRLLTVTGVGPRIAVAFLSTLGAERGARAIQKKDVATLSSVSGVGRKLAERLALELGDKLGELVGDAAPAALSGPAESALAALERLGYGAPEAERALRQALAGDGAKADAETLVRRALHVLTAK